MAQLDVKDLVVNYGMINALKGISFKVHKGEIVALIGANGAGKTTTMHAINGLIPIKSGSIIFESRELTKTFPSRIVSYGLTQVPEGRRVFGELSVKDNLLMGAYSIKNKTVISEAKDNVRASFIRDFENLHNKYAYISEPRYKANYKEELAKEKLNYKETISIVKSEANESKKIETKKYLDDLKNLKSQNQDLASRKEEYLNSLKIIEDKKNNSLNTLKEQFEKNLNSIEDKYHLIKDRDYKLNYKHELKELNKKVDVKIKEAIKEAKQFKIDAKSSYLNDVLALKVKYANDKNTLNEQLKKRKIEYRRSIGITSKEDIKKSLEMVYQKFPILKERSKQDANTLSGGEQQMLAVARALMSHPKVLLLDEPSMGLSPLYVETIFKTIKEINESGTTVLLVEQNAKKALSIADRAYVIETGKITKTGTGKELLNDPDVQKAYLGN